MKNVILITGASSGFGALTARRLAEAGHTVYGTMRETNDAMGSRWKQLGSLPLRRMSIFEPQSWMSVRKSLPTEQ